jgi:hypothetical protein
MPPGSRVKILSIAVGWQEAHQKLQLDPQYSAVHFVDARAVLCLVFETADNVNIFTLVS